MEDAEIQEVDVRQTIREVLELFWEIISAPIEHGTSDRPIELFACRPRVDAHIAEVEQVGRLGERVLSIGVDLEQVAAVAR